MKRQNTANGEKVYELSLPQMQEIYHRELLQDFPANEVKPFSSIQAMWEKKSYYGYALETGGILRAYWFVLYDEFYQVYLLDYLAVVRGNRGNGYGSRALGHLFAHCQEGVVLIEAENPAMANNPSERAMRERRLEFYRKNGVRLTGVCTTVYQAPYVVFLAGGKADESRDDAWVMEVYRHLYRDRILPENHHSEEEAGLQIKKGEAVYGADSSGC